MTNPTDPKMPCHVEAFGKATGRYVHLNGGDWYHGEQKPETGTITVQRGQRIVLVQQINTTVPDHDSPAWGWGALSGMVEQGYSVDIVKEEGRGLYFTVLARQESIRTGDGSSSKRSLCAAINGHPCDKE